VTLPLVDDRQAGPIVVPFIDGKHLDAHPSLLGFVDSSVRSEAGEPAQLEGWRAFVDPDVNPARRRHVLATELHPLLPPQDVVVETVEVHDLLCIPSRHPGLVLKVGPQLPIPDRKPDHENEDHHGNNDPDGCGEDPVPRDGPDGDKSADDRDGGKDHLEESTLVDLVLDEFDQVTQQGRLQGFIDGSRSTGRFRSSLDARSSGCAGKARSPETTLSVVFNSKAGTSPDGRSQSRLGAITGTGVSRSARLVRFSSTAGRCGRPSTKPTLHPWIPSRRSASNCELN